MKEYIAYTYFLTHDNEITPEQASYLADRSMQVLLVSGQMAVHQVAATKFKTERKKNPKKQDSQKKDPKSKKEPAEAQNVPNRKKEPAEAQNVASKGGGRVVGQGKVEGCGGDEWREKKSCEGYGDRSSSFERTLSWFKPKKDR